MTEATGKHARDVPELPPNASVAELAAEIDSARHDAAEAAAALIQRVNVPARMKRVTRDRVRTLRSDGRRVATNIRDRGRRLVATAVAATPDPVADGMRRGGRAAKRVPKPVYVFALALLLMLRRAAHRRAPRD